MSNLRLVSSGFPNLLPSMDRSPGIHHSDVLHDLCVRLGYYQESESAPSLMQLGLAVEDAIANRYSQHYPGRYIRPGEFDIDGLPITLDLVDTSRYGPDEIKLTRLSSKYPGNDIKFNRYRMQVMSQCIALGVRTGRRHICHINGDYTFKSDIDYLVWEEVFTQAELDSHRTLILRHRDRMLREGWRTNHER